MDIDEPALIAVHPSELDHRGDQRNVGAAVLHGRVFTSYRCRNPASIGPGVDVEALIEPEVALYPSVTEQSDRTKSRVLHDLSGHRRLRRDHVVEASHAHASWVESRPHRSH